MTEIVLDAALASKLRELSLPVNLCDPTGRVVGRFVPPIDPSEWEYVTPDVSEEELDRREREREWVTFEQVVERLKRLENPDVPSPMA